jgi:diguanylate cyclase (GGDEF)-like protein
VADEKTKQRLPFSVRNQVLALIIVSSLPTLVCLVYCSGPPRFIRIAFSLLPLATSLWLARTLTKRVRVPHQPAIADVGGNMTPESLTEWLRLVLDLCKATIWQYDPAVCRITATGYPYLMPDGGQELQMELTAFLDAVHAADRVGLAQALHKSVVQEQNFTYEYRLAVPHKQTLWCQMIGKAGCDIAGRPMVTGVVMDITARKQAECEMQRLTKFDANTGLYNRTYFEQELKRLDTVDQLPIGVIVLDINGLKRINNRFNHAVGDRLMQRIAQLLTAVSAADDVTARWGGDEFVMLLPKTAEQAVVQRCDSILQHAAAADDLVPISIALGYAVKASPEEDIYGILGEAEARLSRRKLLENHSAHSSIVATLASTLRERSHETEEHARRLQQLSTALGRNLGLSAAQLDELSLAATLHDIGKVGIRDTILMKPGPLTKEEWQEMRDHVRIGYRIALCSPDLTPVARAILYHHEWWNGQGYLEGLKGHDIPLIARILAIVDAFDVMTHNRPYRPSMSISAACAELKRCAGTQFDAELVDKFIKMISNPQQKQMPVTI